jgi:hypothetical protein
MAEPVLRRGGLRGTVLAGTMLGAAGLVYQGPRDDALLPNRIPEAPPYITEEAAFFPPPFEDQWQTTANPSRCQSCHPRIFDEWKGSMMANAWRDPAWRAAFLLSARQTSTRGDCDTPEPPDGTPKARLNPFAVPGECATRLDLGTRHHTLSRPGSLMDGFCARCHMPTNYVDNVPLHRVRRDDPSGLEHGQLDPLFHPTSDAGTGVAFATDAAQRRNTDSGKLGVACGFCHSFAGTRDTPYHNLARTGDPQREYPPALGRAPRSELLPPSQQDVLEVPDAGAPNLGYGVGAGSFRISPHALGLPERLGPLAAHAPSALDADLSAAFKRPIPYQDAVDTAHGSFRHVLTTRGELCAACHDVTNPLTVKNRLGRWVGGFPIERTYTEWASSRYAERPGNRHYDPRFKRDCQTCHMQQDYGQPGTAVTLFQDGRPRPPLEDRVASDAPVRPYFAHHFVGGNSYLSRVVGAAADDMGSPEPYPELSTFSFSSADKHSPYSNAYWTNVDSRGAEVQQPRLAWDRLRHVVDLELTGPEVARDGEPAAIRIRVTNSGSGHNFPTGFPEGRTAWLAVRAFDLATGRELSIHDAHWKRTSLGVGRLTEAETVDPEFPGCDWKLPAGSPDPYAVQFKAVASLGDGCPTLDLVWASALNLVTDARGLPVDSDGRVIDRTNPRGIPTFRDLDGDGDVFDDAFLRDTRLRPLPHPGATAVVDRYSVVIPPGTRGPVAVVAAVYYQSIEAVAALKLLGNLADTDLDFRLEPCALGGLCDGRVPSGEPGVVEGSPPVPMEVRTRVIRIEDAPWDRQPPRVATYPPARAADVYRDVVPKVFFSEPVQGVNERTFRLTDRRGRVVPASVDQIGDATWALFPDAVFLSAGETYTARLAAGICDLGGQCLRQETVWSFRVAAERGGGSGDTGVPVGFRGDVPLPPPAVVRSVELDAAGSVVVALSSPVMNVTPLTVRLQPNLDPSGDCASPGPPVPVRVAPGATWDLWTLKPAAPLGRGPYCVTVTRNVYDLAGRPVSGPVRWPLEVGRP